MNELIVVDYYIKKGSIGGGSSNNNNSTTSSNIQHHHDATNTPPGISTIRKQQKLYDEYPIWGKDLGKEYMLYEQHTFFPIQYYYTTILPIVRYSCTVPNCGFGQQPLPVSSSSSERNEHTTTTTTTTLRQLQDHLRIQHKLTLCSVCTDHQRDFVSRLPRYNPTGLQKHYQQQHYSCPFCTSTSSYSGVPFYDLNALYLHCHREHYRCHICETHLQITNEFYKTYKSLERHFDTRHYLCHHPTCLANHFIVFHTDLELAHHERTVHHVVSGQTSKIQLEFKFHKHGNNNKDRNNDHNNSSTGNRNTSKIDYQIDGTAFTPPALPSSSSSSSSQRGGDSTNNNHLHPQHAARTEQLRQQAATLRHSRESGFSSSSSIGSHNNDNSNDPGHFEDFNNVSAMAFPSLQDTVTTTNEEASSKSKLNTTMDRLTIGWTADGTRAVAMQKKPAGVVTEEDFPSLATNQKSSKTQTSLSRKKPPPSISTATSSKGTNWTAAAAAAAAASGNRTVTPPIPLAYSTMTTPSTSITSNLKQQSQQQQQQSNVDLADKQSFPSLGAGNKSTMKKAVPYTAAQDFAASIRKSSPSSGTNLSFLSPPQRSATTTTPNTNKVTIPDVSSVDNFPSLSTSNAKKNTNVQSNQKVKNTTTSSSGISKNSTTTLSIDAMKGILGPVGYKAMKTYTREFVNNEMSADSYIDHMASLFPNGYTDVHFWNFVPELIRSFPPSADQDGAFAYMENLQRMKNGALNHEANYHNTKVPASTPTSPALPSKSSTTTTSYATLTSIHAPPVPPQPSIISYTTSTVSKIGGKPKTNHSANAWGSGSASLATNSKPSSLPSVATTTASVPPSVSTRTHSSPQSSTSNNTSKKKSGGSKQRNELRALAFGL
jgi:hypothetical protein